MSRIGVIGSGGVRGQAASAAEREAREGQRMRCSEREFCGTDVRSAGLLRAVLGEA